MKQYEWHELRSACDNTKKLERERHADRIALKAIVGAGVFYVGFFMFMHRDSLLELAFAFIILLGAGVFLWWLHNVTRTSD